MSDFLLRLAQNPQAKKLLAGAGVPLPPELKRGRGRQWEERPLAGRDVLFGGSGQLTTEVAAALKSAGADIQVSGDAAFLSAVTDKAVGSKAVVEGQKFHGLIFDASSFANPADLKSAYEFFHGQVRAIRKSGRAVVLARPVASQPNAAAAATAQALEGFVRSLAKELGRKGATAQLIYVNEGAEAHVEPALRFLLSDRAAYISGQPWTLDPSKASADAPATQPLRGKVALVTGAARGIGAATAAALAREGATIVGLDRPQDAEQLKATLAPLHGHDLLCDISADDAPATIAEALKKHHGGVDIVVHNAGITRDRTLAKMDDSWWDQTIGVNLQAVIAVNDKLIADKVLNEGGRIICLSSIAGIAGNVGQTNYAASKSGIIGYAGRLGAELKERAITANAIAPGFIETRMTAAIPFVTREVARRLSNLSQGGLPEDIAEAITFLASPGSAGVNGRVLRVCGGSLIGKLANHIQSSRKTGGALPGPSGF